MAARAEQGAGDVKLPQNWMRDYPRNVWCERCQSFQTKWHAHWGRAVAKSKWMDEQ